MAGIPAKSTRRAAAATTSPPTVPVTDIAALPLMLRARDVQAITGLHKDGVYQLLHEAGCPTLRFGKSLRVMRDPFWLWLQERAGAQGKDT